MRTEKYGVNASRHRRGYVFSLDATLALFLMVIIVAAAGFFSSQADLDPYGRLQLARIGHDALVVMDSQGVLEDGNATAINQTLNFTLPQGVGGQLQIDTYYFADGSFNLINSTQFGEGAPEGVYVIVMRHDFASVKNRQMTNYSIARLRIWQK